ncbi:unnamed protein product [Oikopleura dioica]|uniref:Small ribosomal subunit protein eS19 n=1 Tax=Oikopleura dioica TaxID=34765 RepID=E4XBR5_OIKDI|nr:unnamed protein product [Oikopleura dioica]
MPSICVKDVDQQEFVKAFSVFLKNSGKVKVPEWADIVKTATHKELAPYDPDWFYVRCASLARHLYMRGNAGVGAFRKVYGGSRHRGVAPNHFHVANGNLIRKALQALEACKILEKSNFRGRVITRVGRRDMDRVAGALNKPAAE